MSCNKGQEAVPMLISASLPRLVYGWCQNNTGQTAKEFLYRHTIRCQKCWCVGVYNVCSTYSIMEGSFVSRMWSVRIQGMDISIGNWIRRPMVSSRKNSRNQSCDRSQHCWRASENQLRHVYAMTVTQETITAIQCDKGSAIQNDIHCCIHTLLRTWFECCVFCISIKSDFSPLKLRRWV